MSKPQKYDPALNQPMKLEPITPKFNRISSSQFFSQNKELICQPIYPDDLFRQLPDSLRLDGVQHTAIRYKNILDGLKLVRSVMPPITDQTDDYHAALLIGKRGIVELVLINYDEQGFGTNISPRQLNSRYLMNRLMASNARAVLIVSVSSAYDISFTPVDNTYVEALSETLAYFDVQLIDWVLMNREYNLSYEQLMGWDYRQDGIRNLGEVYTIGVND